jgi:hypothetical protein
MGGAVNSDTKLLTSVPLLGREALEGVAKSKEVNANGIIIPLEPNVSHKTPAENPHRPAGIFVFVKELSSGFEVVVA